MLALRYRNFWILASAVLLCVVVWGSLQTALKTGVVEGFDKVQHFGTYLFLSVWFTGLCSRERYWVIAAGLLALGALMEVGQLAMRAGRSGDPYDIAANTGGLAVGLLLAWALTGGWAQKIEGWLR
jgi:VanZ family protein